MYVLHMCYCVTDSIRICVWVCVVCAVIVSCLFVLCVRVCVHVLARPPVCLDLPQPMHDLDVC